MIVILLMIVGIVLCWVCPWWIGAIIWIVNAVCPDTLPFVDELLGLPGPIRQFIKYCKYGRTAGRIIKGTGDK